MNHFFVAPDQITDGLVTIKGADILHIVQVLRMKPGEEILVDNGENYTCLCELLEVGLDGVTAKVCSRREEDRELPARITLFQGLPKGDKMELIIQKAVELGVFQIVPVITRRTIVKLEGARAAARVDRWNLIAESAAKQSMRSRIPKVTSLIPFTQACEQAATLDKSLIPFEHARGMEEARREMSSIRAGMTAGILIGPEGGFEDEEIQTARDLGIIPITLGGRILRTETAGMAVLSILMFQLDGMNTTGE